MSEPRHARPLSVDKVVVGADPSPGAHVALRWAAALAAPFDAELIVVHARGLLDALRDHGDEPPDWLLDMVGELDPGVRVALTVLDGTPPDALLRAVDASSADLVVVGRRGAGSPLEASLGSTSREVSSRATVPVLVVPT